MVYRVCSAAIVTLCLLAGAAWGCEGTTLIFEDDFQDDLGGWDKEPAMKIEHGAMVLRPPGDRVSLSELNTAFLATDVDACTEVVLPTEPPDSGLAAGIVFWAVDYGNYYLAVVTVNGRAALYRRSNQKWFKVWEEEPSQVRSGLGASNLLRVVAKGNRVSVYVNGAKVKDTRVQVPPGETRFGTYVERNKAVEGHAFSFRNFKVTKPN